MKLEDYIIDFERINYLTTAPDDDTSCQNDPFMKGRFTYSISRSTIKDFLRIFIDNIGFDIDQKRNKEKIKYVVEVLEHNKVLLHKSSIREKKIDSIVN